MKSHADELGQNNIEQNSQLARRNSAGVTAD
jgi:hypothetical protein